MSGGISNVLVREPWMNDNRHLILDYYRGVSTGPSLPIVLTPTTFGDHLSLGVSYRVAGFTQAKIESLLQMLRDQLEHPEKPSRRPFCPARSTPATTSPCNHPTVGEEFLTPVEA